MKLVSSSKDIVFVDHLDERFGKVNFIFISRHRAESGVPSLTAHFTGNFGPASFGGRPGEISHYEPSLLKNYFIALNSLKEKVAERFQLTLEATHHGPTSLSSPVLFAELGSTEEQWADTQAAEIVAEALVRGVSNKRTYRRCALAIGGTHYPDKFNRMLAETEIALGPIIPKYSLEFFNAEILGQALKKSTEPITIAVVDAKGLGRFKEAVFSVLNGSSLEIIKA